MNKIETYEELINSICGVDNNKMPKSILGLQKEIVRQNGDIEIYDSISFNNSIIDIVVDGEYMLIDANFISPKDQNLRLCWNFLNNYYKDIKEKELNDGDYCNLVIVLIPEEYEGEYSLIASKMLMFSLTAEKPGGDTNVIRLAFHGDEVIGLFNDDEEFIS